eukprot:3686966-Rhodomonas_salina.1
MAGTPVYLPPEVFFSLVPFLFPLFFSCGGTAGRYMFIVASRVRDVWGHVGGAGAAGGAGDVEAGRLLLRRHPLGAPRPPAPLRGPSAPPLSPPGRARGRARGRAC